MASTGFHTRPLLRSATVSTTNIATATSDATADEHGNLSGSVGVRRTLSGYHQRRTRAGSKDDTFGTAVSPRSRLALQSEFKRASYIACTAGSQTIGGGGAFDDMAEAEERRDALNDLPMSPVARFGIPSLQGRSAATAGLPSTATGHRRSQSLADRTGLTSAPILSGKELQMRFGWSSNMDASSADQLTSTAAVTDKDQPRTANTSRIGWSEAAFAALDRVRQQRTTALHRSGARSVTDLSGQAASTLTANDTAIEPSPPTSSSSSSNTAARFNSAIPMRSQQRTESIESMRSVSSTGTSQLSYASSSVAGRRVASSVTSPSPSMGRTGTLAGNDGYDDVAMTTTGKSGGSPPPRPVSYQRLSAIATRRPIDLGRDHPEDASLDTSSEHSSGTVRASWLPRTRRPAPVHDTFRDSIEMDEDAEVDDADTDNGTTRRGSQPLDEKYFSAEDVMTVVPSVDGRSAPISPMLAAAENDAARSLGKSDSNDTWRNSHRFSTGSKLADRFAALDIRDAVAQEEDVMDSEPLPPPATRTADTTPVRRRSLISQGLGARTNSTENGSGRYRAAMRASVDGSSRRSDRPALPASFKRLADEASNAKRLSEGSDRNDAVDDILRSLEVEEEDEAGKRGHSAGDEPTEHQTVLPRDEENHRQHMLRSSLRALNGQRDTSPALPRDDDLADDIGTGSAVADRRYPVHHQSPRLAAVRSFSRPISASGISTESPDRAHARHLSELPGSVSHQLGGRRFGRATPPTSLPTATTTAISTSNPSRTTEYGHQRGISMSSIGASSWSQRGRTTPRHHTPSSDRDSPVTPSTQLSSYGSRSRYTNNSGGTGMDDDTRSLRTSSRRSYGDDGSAGDQDARPSLGPRRSSDLHRSNSRNGTDTAAAAALDVDNGQTRAQQLLQRAQQDFCSALRHVTTAGQSEMLLPPPSTSTHRSLLSMLDTARDDTRTSAAASLTLSPRLAPFQPGSVGAAAAGGDDVRQYSSPGGRGSPSAGGVYGVPGGPPSVASRLQEVVSSAVRLDRALRQVAASGHSHPSDGMVTELWRDSEQVVRGLTDVLLGLSAGVPRSRSPTGYAAGTATTGTTPRATSPRANGASISGRLSANGRTLPAPLQMPASSLDRTHQPSVHDSLGDFDRYTHDEVPAPKSAAAIATRDSQRRQRALSQLISPATTRSSGIGSPSSVSGHQRFGSNTGLSATTPRHTRNFTFNGSSETSLSTVGERSQHRPALSKSTPSLVPRRRV